MRCLRKFDREVVADKPICGTFLMLWEGRGLGFPHHALRRLTAVPTAGGCVMQQTSSSLRLRAFATWR